MSKFTIPVLSLSLSLWAAATAATLTGLAGVAGAEETPEVKPAQPQVQPVTPPVVPAPAPKDPAVTEPGKAPVQPAPQPPQVVTEKAPQPPVAGDPPPPVVPLMNPAPRDTTAAKKLLEELESDDAAKSEPAVKALLKGLDASIPKFKLTYLAKLSVDVNGAAAPAHADSMKKLVDVMKTIHQSAAEALLQIVSTIAAPDPKLDDPDGVDRLASAINETLKADEINPFIENLAATEPAVVEQATKKLLEYGADASDLLANAVGDERLPVKKAAADILKKMGPAGKDAASGLAFLLDNDDKMTRRLAATVLDNLGPDMADAADDLLGYLDNDDKSVRRVATNLLKKIGPALKEKAPDIVDRLTDPDKNTRALGTELLLNLGPDAVDAVDPLTALIEDAQGNDPDSRKRAARVLGAIGPAAKEALPVLKKSQDDLDVQVKDAIADAIKHINGEAPVADPKKVEPEPEEPDEKPAPDKPDAPKADAPKTDAPIPEPPKAVANPDPKPEVKPEVKPDVKPEAKPEVKPDVKPEEKK